MKKSALIFSIVIIAAFSIKAFACVGRTLTIGSLQSENEKILSQMLSVIINERTGTTVNVEYFDTQQELYEAMKAGKVSILIENTDRALQLLGQAKDKNAQSSYQAVKDAYKEKFDFVLLDAFGESPADSENKQYLYFPVIPGEILIDYPALPRVVNKLGGVLEDKAYGKLKGTVDAGDKPKSAAKDFLKKKRLI